MLGTFSTLGKQIPLVLGRNEAGGHFRYRAPLNNVNPESFYPTFGVHCTLVSLREEAGGVGNGHRSRVHSQSYYLEEAGLSGGN